MLKDRLEILPRHAWARNSGTANREKERESWVIALVLRIHIYILYVPGRRLHFGAPQLCSRAPVHIYVYTNVHRCATRSSLALGWTGATAEISSIYVGLHIHAHVYTEVNAAVKRSLWNRRALETRKRRERTGAHIGGICQKESTSSSLHVYTYIRMHSNRASRDVLSASRSSNSIYSPRRCFINSRVYTLCTPSSSPTTLQTLSLPLSRACASVTPRHCFAMQVNIAAQEREAAQRRPFLPAIFALGRGESFARERLLHPLSIRYT